MVLSVIFDSVNQCSFLLVLDARSFVDIARYKVPHVVPAGIHGSFLSDAVVADLSRRAQ